MSADIRPATAKDSPALLQLGKGNDGARVFYRAHGYGERAGFELHDKMLER